ncbi:unnamed protein product [Rhizophagus irregularis]|nr:unnamed protein product [Rhizophagus irregularis]
MIWRKKIFFAFVEILTFLRRSFSLPGRDISEYGGNFSSGILPISTNADFDATYSLGLDATGYWMCGFRCTHLLTRSHLWDVRISKFNVIDGS